MIDTRASEGETARLRALEDAVTAFAKVVGSHSPPLIGFYPAEAADLRASIGQVYRLAIEAAGMLERAHGVGTAEVARRLREWCQANKRTP